MKKDEEFSEWYNGLVDGAELSDKRYPIKGMNVWRPYGWAIMKLIDQAMREEFDSTGNGEGNFPVLIPDPEPCRPAAEGVPDRPRLPLLDEDDADLHACPGDPFLRSAHCPRDVRGW